MLLVAASVGSLLHREAVALVEPLRPHVRHERPQLEPVRSPLLGQFEETGAHPAARPGWVDIELLNPVFVQDHQAERRAVISACEPHLLFLNDTAHPVPDLVV